LTTTAAFILPLLMGAPALAQTTAPTGATTMAPAASTTTESSAMAQTPGGTGGGAISATDRTFVTKAAQGGLAEVQMAQLAQQKTQDPTIKQFAQTMIDDHTPANEKLAQLAASDGLTAPTEPSATQMKMMSHLQGLDGSKFDHSYITGQLKAHKMMLKLVQNEATNGSNPQLKAFAEQLVPVIQKHISLAESAQNAS
jgi:putative membrane protein